MNNRESERGELHKTIWRIANDLRGSVDGWDFKSYVLGMLFYRFISENLTSYLNEQERKAGNAVFNYAALGDEEAEFGRVETVREKGFYILPSELFVNVRQRARHDENLNETLAGVFAHIEGSANGFDSEDDFKGLFDDLDVNSGKLGSSVSKRNEKLVRLLDAIGDLPLANGGSFSRNSINPGLSGHRHRYRKCLAGSGADFPDRRLHSRTLRAEDQTQRQLRSSDRRQYHPGHQQQKQSRGAEKASAPARFQRAVCHGLHRGSQTLLH